MPFQPKGYGGTIFGVGLFVSQGPYADNTTPTAVEPLPARAGPWPESLQPTRVSYSFINQAPPPPLESVPPGLSVQQLVARPEWPRVLRTWYVSPQLSGPVVAETLPTRAGPWPEGLQPPRLIYGWTVQAQPTEVVVGLPLNQYSWPLVRAAEYPRSLRSWTFSQLAEEQAPVGEAAQETRRALDYPRSLRSWLRTQLFEEPLPIGQAAQSLVARAEWPRVLRTWLQWQQLQEVVEQAPIGTAVQQLVRWKDYTGLRFWSQGIANLLTGEPEPAGQTTQPLVARPEWPRFGRTWIAAQLLEEPTPFRVSWVRTPGPARKDYWYAQASQVGLFTQALPEGQTTGPLPRRFRADYGWIQLSNISLLTEVSEQLPIGRSAQTLIRWVPYPTGLRTFTRSQTLEEGLPVGTATQQRLRDPEYLRSLRSRTQGQLLEERMPFGKDEWPIPLQPRRSYNWVQQTNLALLTQVIVAQDVPARSGGDWPKVLPERSAYGWVQATSQALRAPAESVPVGGSVQQRLRDPEYLRVLRSRTQRVPYEERMPVGRSAFRRNPDPEFLRNLRAWSRTQTLEERMPVGKAAFRRVPDPEFLRSLRSRVRWMLPLETLATHQFITPEFFDDPDEFFPPNVLQGAPEPTYDYPIGRGLRSDYGRRGRPNRLIIGRR